MNAGLLGLPLLALLLLAVAGQEEVRGARADTRCLRRTAPVLSDTHIGAGWAGLGAAAPRLRHYPTVPQLPTAPLLPLQAPGPYKYNEFMLSLTTSPQPFSSAYGHFHQVDAGGCCPDIVL